MQGSDPFSLSTADWIKIGKGAALAVTGALASYATANFIPSLREHVANDSGILIVTVVGALVPVLANLARKYFQDTTV